jgi:Na+/H+ antiporter NhaD/arsenite permease-like protein
MARLKPASFLSLLALALIVGLAIASAFAPQFMPGDVDQARQVAGGGIFAASYIALAIGRVPGLAIDRAGIALVGASLMVASGAMTIEAAYKAVDLETITLLLGMMIVVASLRLSGFFGLATLWLVRKARRPVLLLAALVLAAGVFSAFLVNDAICLVMAPLVTELTLASRRNPVPYLLAVAMASNIGSTATITGNPQNMLIGSFSRIPYVVFAENLAPVAAVGLLVAGVLIVLMHRGEFRATRITIPEERPRANAILIARALGATAVLIGLFFSGQSPAKAAIIIGALLLLTRRVRSSRIYAEIDWSLLLMFAGLFIIVAGAEQRLLTQDAIQEVGRLHLDRVPVLSAVTAVLSNLVSNVPAVLVLQPFVEAMHDRQHAWLVVAMASTFAGNFTLLGSIANLIVAEKAGQNGIQIGFWTYFRVGAPVTILTLVIGTLWLMR